MPRVHKTTIWMLGFASAALLAMPANAVAQADDDSVRLSGAVRFASDLPTVQLTTPSLEQATLVEDTTDVNDFTPVTRQTHEADSRGTASALAWYERFTVAPSESQVVWGLQQREFQLQGGNRWGLTFGYIESDRQPQSLSVENMRFGGFIEFSERFRFGGELRFTSPEEEIFGEETETKEPELRFESAFRF